MAAAGEGAIDFVEPAVNTIYIDLIMIGIIGARWALKIATFVVVVSAMCELSCFGLCVCVVFFFFFPFSFVCVYKCMHPCITVSYKFLQLYKSLWDKNTWCHHSGDV